MPGAGIASALAFQAGQRNTLYFGGSSAAHFCPAEMSFTGDDRIGYGQLQAQRL